MLNTLNSILPALLGFLFAAGWTLAVIIFLRLRDANAALKRANAEGKFTEETLEAIVNHPDGISWHQHLIHKHAFLYREKAPDEAYGRSDHGEDEAPEPEPKRIDLSHLSVAKLELLLDLADDDAKTKHGEGRLAHYRLWSELHRHVPECNEGLWDFRYASPTKIYMVEKGF